MNTKNKSESLKPVIDEILRDCPRLKVYPEFSEAVKESTTGHPDFSDEYKKVISGCIHAGERMQPVLIFTLTSVTTIKREMNMSKKNNSRNGIKKRLPGGSRKPITYPPRSHVKRGYPKTYIKTQYYNYLTVSRLKLIHSISTELTAE